MLRALKRLLRRASIDPSQLAFPLTAAPSAPAAPGGARPRPRRRRTRDEQQAAAVARLVTRHAALNAERFAGTLRSIRIEVSPRLRSRLGYYRIATARQPGLIVISRRHLRRHGWDEAYETLLHEMVHQWQDEAGLPVDHGKQFRAKARQVGAVPRARRPVV